MRSLCKAYSKRSQLDVLTRWNKVKIRVSSHSPEEAENHGHPLTWYVVTKPRLESAKFIIVVLGLVNHYKIIFEFYWALKMYMGRYFLKEWVPNDSVEQRQCISSTARGAHEVFIKLELFYSLALVALILLCADCEPVDYNTPSFLFYVFVQLGSSFQKNILIFFTFMLPCVVTDFFLITNQMH